MNLGYYTTLNKLLKEIPLEIAFMPRDPQTIKIESTSINRLGLELIGPIEQFDNKRIIIMGESERYFLSTLSSEEIYNSVEAILAMQPPVMIIAFDIKPLKEIMEVAEKHGVPILLYKDSVADLTTELTPFLNMQLAPRITRSGELINVHGEGILLIGESGIGKSEITLELLKRGHKFIADDVVEIKKISKNMLIGSALEDIRHFIEVRGIGIINARQIFGIGAVKLSETIDMVINLESWKDEKNYDRIETANKCTEILGVKIPYLTIPVCPGRNLAVLIEIAAMSNRQRKMGYNAAKELFNNLGMEYPSSMETQTVEKCIWDI